MIEGGVFGPVKNCGCSPGTVIEVRNLFYNIPVRRTFLKSDMTESGHVVDMFSRIALAHPEVHLTYRSGSKVVYDLPPVAGHARADRDLLRTRAGRVVALGRGPARTTCSSGATSAHPSQSRSTAKGQFLFLGGRYVRDRSLSHALNEAYRGLLWSAGCRWRSSTWRFPPRRWTSTSTRPRSRSGSATRSGSTATCSRPCGRRF